MSMNTIEDRLRKAGRDINTAVAVSSSPSESPVRSRRGVLRPLIAAAAVTLVVVGGPMLFLMSDDSGVDVGDSGVSESTSFEEAAPVVKEYWALDGHLDSVGSEEGWLCPVRGPEGYTSIVAPSDVPASLMVDLPGHEAEEEFNRSDGPECHQPATMVLVDFTDSSMQKAESAIAVWPSATRWDDLCLEGCAFSGDAETPTINGQPALLHTHPGTGSIDLWWIDSSGAPMYAQASGVTSEELTALAGFMTVDLEGHSVGLAVLPDSEPDPDEEPLPEVLEGLFDRLDHVEITPSVGVWDDGYWRGAAYFSESPGVVITTLFDAAFDPYAMLARSVDHAELVDVNGSVGVLVSDGFDRVTFRRDDGAVVSVDAEAAEENSVDPVEIARQLR